MSQAPPVLLLFGPTAVGKTELSLQLAETLGTELIYADSMAVYRRMDIGTAKPCPEDRSRVPHHLIDVADPTEEFSAKRFLALARPILDRLTREGRLPVVIGGTGLYFRALSQGLVGAEAADALIIRKLEDTADRSGPESLHRELMQVDPEAAARIQPTDRRRLVRALSVFRAHGKPLSQLQRETSRGLACRFFRVGLLRDRKELYSRINCRVDRMVESGLVDETRQLMKKGLSRSAGQALGYKEIIDHLQGRSTLEEAVDRIKTRTRRLAKRQFTWFRGEPDVTWLDMTGRDSRDDVLEVVSGFLVELLDPWLACGRGNIAT